MGLSIANVHSQFQALSVGNLNGRLIQVTFDSSYASGGESLTAASVGLSEIFYVGVSPDAGVLPGLFVEYDYVNAKLVVRQNVDPAAAGGADVALAPGAGDYSTLKVRLLVLGI